MIQQDQALYDKFMQRVITLSTQAFSDNASEMDRRYIWMGPRT